jgi:hypothetical protein
MTDTETADELADIKSAIESQTAGLVRMLGVMATHTDMLKQILAAVTAEPEGEGPIVTALKQLTKIAEANRETLGRIDKSLRGVGPG